MGKGTDKLYITHSEWSSGDAYSASAGSNLKKAENSGQTFKRLPYNFCSLSLQPFEHPVCTSNGTIFDLTNILPWLKKHGTNPVDGSPLKSSDLIKLTFCKNEDDEYVDPVTYKVFTDNTHIVALRNTGNVFAHETVERLNIKAKNWKDLVTDQEFTKQDILDLQDPLNVSARDLSSFKYLKDGISVLTPEQEEQRSAGVNTMALGSAGKILKAKDAVAKARAAREQAEARPKGIAAGDKRAAGSGVPQAATKTPYDAARHTTGKAAASLTSTGFTPHTGNEPARLSEEEYMLKRGRVKVTGFAKMHTTQGELLLELYPEQAPRAVWNFVKLAHAGYYRGLPFHRNIKNFMIQGGDPTGTGRGGTSIWKKNFVDEFDNALKHDARGTLSMANKGKDSNSSQFFLTYRAVPHLDRKHTIFGRVVEGLDGTLSSLENVKTGEKDRPAETCVLEDVVILIDPFEEFAKQQSEMDTKRATAKVDAEEDDRTTWTGKRIRADGTVEGLGPADSVGVGKYMAQAAAIAPATAEQGTLSGDWDGPKRRPSKKVKSGGFGNFDNW